jgi:hypothetical protein
MHRLLLCADSRSAREVRGRRAAHGGTRTRMRPYARAPRVHTAAIQVWVPSELCEVVSPRLKHGLERRVSRFSTICAKNLVLKLKKNDKVTVIRVSKSPFLVTLPCNNTLHNRDAYESTRSMQKAACHQKAAVHQNFENRRCYVHMSRIVLFFFNVFIG